MKKKMIALLAGLMLTLAAGNAMAYFGTNDIFMAAYNTTTNQEVVIDLGTLSGSAGSYTLTSSGTSSFNLTSALGAGATAATTNVAFYGYTLGANKIFASDASPTDLAAAGLTNPVSAYNGAAGFISAVTAINTVAGSTSATYLGSTTNLQGYNSKMNASGPGSFAGLNDFGAATTGFYTPEQTLANLAAGTLMGLYQFNGSGIANKPSNTGILEFTAGITNVGGVETITMNSVNSPATPIPAAIYLMGSGLLGMFGLRRKQRG